MYTVYSKDNCKFCDKVEKVFKLKDLPYKKYILDEDFTREEFISEFGEGSTFPRVIDQSGKLIGGAKETVDLLRTQGII